MTSYTAIVINSRTRQEVTRYSFGSDVLKGRTPLETAWDLVGLFVQSKAVFVKLVK